MRAKYRVHSFFPSGPTQGVKTKFRAKQRRKAKEEEARPDLRWELS